MRAPSIRRVPPWATIAVLALCGMATSLQFTLAIPLLPSMPQILSAHAADTSWVVTVTLLTSTIVTPLSSRLADMYGKRRMLLFSLGAMLVGSVVVALGGSLLTMLIGRGLQGCAAGAIPIGISLLREQLPSNRVGSAVALMSATMGMGSALGMPLSGVLHDALGWQSVFWFSAAAGAALGVGVLVCVSESSIRTHERFDVLGAALFSIPLTCGLLALSMGARWGASVAIGLSVCCVGVLAAWIAWELRIRAPFVDLRTMSRRPIVVTNTASFLTTMAMLVNMLVTTQQVQAPHAGGLGLGETITAAGLVMLPAGIAMILLSPLSGALLNRFGGKPVLIAGGLTMAAALLVRAWWDAGILELTIGSTLVGVGTALSYAAAPTLIMASTPVTETAAANGLNSMVRYLGTAVASALIAFIASVMSVEVAGQAVLTRDAVHLALYVAAAASALAAILALLLPTRAPGLTTTKNP